MSKKELIKQTAKAFNELKKHVDKKKLKIIKEKKVWVKN